MSHNNISPYIALKLAISIMQKWSCSQLQVQKVLALDLKFMKNVNRFELSDEQILRIGYVVNIHFALRSLFSNKLNVYGFMKMRNNNEFFAGRAPIELIEQGCLEDLKNTSNFISSIANW